MSYPQEEEGGCINLGEGFWVCFGSFPRLQRDRSEELKEQEAIAEPAAPQKESPDMPLSADEREVINRVMRRIQPGKHFLGLWIYRQKNHRKVTPLWTCTLWDANGQYVETPLRKTAYAALRDVERELWADPSGKEGRAKKRSNHAR